MTSHLWEVIISTIISHKWEVLQEPLDLADDYQYSPSGDSGLAAPSRPTPRCRLRPMEESDIDAVFRLVSNAMNEDEGNQARETLEFHFACRRYGMDDGRTYFVLPDENGVFGIVGLHRYLWGPPENVWLAWFAVDPSLRGGGFGKLMMAFIVDRAIELGYVKLYVETYSTPEFATARKFYESSGFTRAGEVDSYLPNGGHMIVYAKELNHHV